MTTNLARLLFLLLAAAVAAAAEWNPFAPLLFFGGVVAVAVATDVEGLSFGFLLLLVLGLEMRCSPVSFYFRVGGSVAGCGASFRSPVSVMADLLGEGFGDGGRCTTTSSHAATNCWRPRSESSRSSPLGTSGSSPTPAGVRDPWKPGGANGPGTSFSNSFLFRVFCVIFRPWSLCSEVLDVISGFSRGLVVKVMG